MALFEAAQKVSKDYSNDMEAQKKNLMTMIFPEGSSADDSPLHVVCCNDTCSFTWTGKSHTVYISKHFSISWILREITFS